MKRSTHIRLTLMAVALPAALTGCEAEPPTGQVLNFREDCDYQKEVDPAQCRAAYDTALREHERVAPRFENNADCAADFGACTPVADQNGTRSWIPPMSGFLLGYAVSNALNSANAGGGYRTIGGSSPLYRNYHSGRYIKPNGDVASRGTGQVTGRAGNAAVPARAVTISRSGFGSSSAARSSFGGGRSGGFGG